MTNRFRDKLEKTDDFLMTFELVPGRNPKGKKISKILSFAAQANEDGLLDALSITDNPGGNPSLSPDVLGREIQNMGIDTIVHFTCRDHNRYGIFSRAIQLERLSIENLLVLTGDYPAENQAGTAKPCFDLDSTTALCMLEGMNNGNPHLCEKQLSPANIDTTNFHLGAGVSCFKYSESEVINQYYKLHKKINNGAKFIITQICYDARKFDELQQFIKKSNCDIPVIGSIYVLNEMAAKFMNAGKVPGVYVTDRLLGQITEEAKAADKGKAASLERSAKLMAVLNGLGYRGAHIAGSVGYDDIKKMIEKFHEIKDDWQKFIGEFDYAWPGGFYLFHHDKQVGLNTGIKRPRSQINKGSYICHGFMKMMHGLGFNKDAVYYKMQRNLAGIIDKSVVLENILSAGENVSKYMLFHCQQCGDCALQDMGYLCPESQCPKFLRNGPCGGSNKSKCEVRTDHTCVWERVYQRLKSHSEEERLRGNCMPPRNWALTGTSSWINFYLDRDHHATTSKCKRFCEIIKSAT